MRISLCLCVSGAKPLVSRVRQKSDVARALYRLSQHTLVRGADAGNSPRQNLAAFGRVGLQKFHILEIDVIDLVDAKPADLSPLHASRSATGHAGAFVFPLKTICAVALVKIRRHSLSFCTAACRAAQLTAQASSLRYSQLSGRFSFGLVTLNSLCFALAGGRTSFGFTRAPILQLIRTTTIFVHAHSHVAKNPIVHAHAAFQFGDFRARSVNLEQDVNAVAPVIDFVRELPLTHHLGLRDAAALISDDLLHRFSQPHHFRVFGVRVDDENYFVSSFFCHFVLQNQ